MVVSGMVSGAGSWRVHIFTCKHKAEKANQRWDQAMSSHRLHPLSTSSSKTVPSHQTVPPTGDQVFRSLSLGEIFAFKRIQATIHKYPFMHIHMGTHVVLWIHRNAIINVIANKFYMWLKQRFMSILVFIFYRLDKNWDIVINPQSNKYRCSSVYSRFT